MKKLFVLGLIVVSVFVDIFYFSASSDFRFFGLIGAYAVSAKWLKLESAVTFLWCLALLVVMYVLFLTTGTSVKTERTAVWFVLFMIVGVIQQGFGHKRGRV